jgi:hypothetical protein
MRRLLAVIFIISTCLCAGCVKMHMDTIIEKDGSGTCTISYGTSRAVSDALSNMEAAGGNAPLDANPLLPQDMSRSHIEELCRETGIALLDHRFIDDQDEVGLTMRLGFDDITDLSHFLNIMSGAASGSEVEQIGIFDEGDGQLVLKTETIEAVAPEPYDEDGDDLMDDDLDMESMQDAFESMSVLMAHLQELDMRMTITVPGKVIHSNAMEVEERTSIWSFNAANMMQAADFDVQPLIRFEGEGISIKARKPSP